MTGWSTLDGRAVALAQANIDTDQLIPARFMSTPRSDGYGRFLLHDVRQDQEDHVLNRFRSVDVLIARANFGSGSSREAAVYALADFGVRAVFAPSFGDIFASNAVNNAVLPARLSETEIETLIASLGTGDASAHVDLADGVARIGAHEVRFDLDPVWRKKLINGWDDIDLTAQHETEISEFCAARKAAYPWAWPISKDGFAS